MPTDAEGEALADVAVAAVASASNDDDNITPTCEENGSRSSNRLAAKKLAASTSSNLPLLLQRRDALVSELRALDEQIRQARASGEVEPDSLLAVDGDFFDRMMPYLDAPSLGRSEMVYKRFRQLAPRYWKKMGGFKDEDGPGSSVVGASLRMKAIRHVLASNFAENMGVTIQCRGCTGKTPWKLDVQFYNERAELEFFVRCINKHTGTVLAQGFVQSDCRPEYSGHCKEIACDRPHAFETRLHIKDLDLSSWSCLSALCPVPDGAADNELLRQMNEIMGETSVTVVAMRRDSLDLKLVAASCEPHGRHGIRYSHGGFPPPEDFCMEFMIPDPHATRKNPMYTGTGPRGYRNWSGLNFVLDEERCMMLRLSKDYNIGP